MLVPCSDLECDPVAPVGHDESCIFGGERTVLGHGLCTLVCIDLGNNSTDDSETVVLIENPSHSLQYLLCCQSFGFRMDAMIMKAYCLVLKLVVWFGDNAIANRCFNSRTSSFAIYAEC